MANKWRPVGDSNPCCRDENPVSWTWLDERDNKVTTMIAFCFFARPNDLKLQPLNVWLYADVLYFLRFFLWNQRITPPNYAELASLAFVNAIKPVPVEKCFKTVDEKGEPNWPPRLLEDFGKSREFLFWRLSLIACLNRCGWENPSNSKKLRKEVCVFVTMPCGFKVM